MTLSSHVRWVVRFFNLPSFKTKKRKKKIAYHYLQEQKYGFLFDFSIGKKFSGPETSIHKR
jgi:hypothetical protein